MRRLGPGARRGHALCPSAAGCGVEGRDLPWRWFRCILSVRPNSRIPVALGEAGQAQQFSTPSPPCDGHAVHAQGPLTGGQRAGARAAVPRLPHSGGVGPARTPLVGGLDGGGLSCSGSARRGGQPVLVGNTCASVDGSEFHS